MGFRVWALLATLFVIPATILSILVFISGQSVPGIYLATITATGSLTSRIARIEGQYITLTPWGYCLKDNNGNYDCTNVNFAKAFDFTAATTVPDHIVPMIGEYQTLIANFRANDYGANNPFVFLPIFIAIISWGLVLLSILVGLTLFKRIMGISAFFAAVGTTAFIVASILSYVFYDRMQNTFNNELNGSYTISVVHAYVYCWCALGGVATLILIRAGIVAYRQALQDSARSAS
ncbi:hypothetical protein SeMB42_g03509 [Synchytrium endobioticum]|uniref:Uncharacterized protein n=1 Tax=Synchytrium endobioticum TaxID=286115 RepID=A0A507D838_9FUNG|nr:hypothetical protein SeMB42_g03509 [Synchytrium endobioticum]